MRVGIDARLWNETGVGRYIRNLVRQLHVLDTKNEYVLFVKEGFSSAELGFTNKRWRLVETDIRWHTIDEQLVFYKVLENELLDIVHFPYFSIPILYNRPFIITIHDLIINHFPTGKASTLPLPFYYIKRFAYNFILKEAAKKAKKILAVSEGTKKEIIEHLKVSGSKILVTYEGVDEKIFSPTERGKLNRRFDWNSKYFLYVGNAYPHKNLERLVDAFDLVHKEYPEVKLVLVGKKDYFYTKLEEKVKKIRLENSVIFFDSASDSELGNLYKHAQALLYPSLMEGFGLPGLEAMQHKCLVVASDIPVFKEIYKDTVLYFNPLDIDEMHATIREVLQRKKEYTSLIEKGARYVKAFSWERMAKETLKVYESSVSLR